MLFRACASTSRQRVCRTAARRCLSISSGPERKICIVGGGPVGMAAAVHLARMGLGHEVVLVERDLSYVKSSAMLSAGGMRQQFSLKENIQLSMYSLEFLRDLEASNASSGNSGDDSDVSVQFKPNGYMFMASTDAGRETLTQNHAAQLDCGADWIHYTEDVLQLQQLYPWLNTDGILAATYSNGGGEGYFDPWACVHLMKKEAQRLGVQIIEGKVLTSRGADGERVVLPVGRVVNCAGAYAGQLTGMFAKRASADGGRDILQLPVHPRKRCIFALHCPALASFSHPAPTSAAPLTVDPSGVYFRGEGVVGAQGGHFIAGVSPSADRDPDCFDDSSLDVVDHDLFEEVIWPTLAARVPAFNEIKVISSWAGFYDFNVLDQNLIIGYHPDITNMLHCNGFSGHGLQMGPAAGRAVAEFVQYGTSTSIDLSKFSMERVVENRPYFETGIV
eukprot:GSChrysophyteH1.ASY1.ANO1.1699.1 assembled CDS